MQHASKILKAINDFPYPNTHKGDVSAKLGRNATLTQFSDGSILLKLYDTVVFRRSMSTSYVDHGGYKTPTTMRWVLSMLDALKLPAVGSTTKGRFVVNGVDVDGLTKVAE